jgi:membrane protein implicated in regulation of membrane protease activity
MQWWLWILLGLGLLAFEVATPGGLFALFFGVAALVVGALASLVLAGPPWFQWLLFAALSVAAVALLRPRLRERIAPRQVVDAIVGETAVTLVELQPRGVGKAELRGSAWEARNVAEVPLVAGQRCRVERVDGLTLLIRPE